MMKNQLAGLMKQAQAMQDNMKKAQEEIAKLEIEGQAGAGLVKVVMTGRHDVKRVTIDPTLLTEDKDMLEDLVAAAFALPSLLAYLRYRQGGSRAGGWYAASLFLFLLAVSGKLSVATFPMVFLAIDLHDKVFNYGAIVKLFASCHRAPSAALGTAERILPSNKLVKCPVR